MAKKAVLTVLVAIMVSGGLWALYQRVAGAEGGLSEAQCIAFTDHGLELAMRQHSEEAGKPYDPAVYENLRSSIRSELAGHPGEAKIQIPAKQIDDLRQTVAACKEHGTEKLLRCASAAKSLDEYRHCLN